jgi:hypothetical protein
VKKLSGLDSLSSLIKDANIPILAKSGFLANPDGFLSAIENEMVHARVDLNQFEMLQPWCLVAMAALARKNASTSSIHFSEVNANPNEVARFANAMGFFDLINGRKPWKGEIGRTVKIQSVNNFNELESVAHHIANLITDQSIENEYLDHIETRYTIYYVMVELLRNAVQHSFDPNGGVIVAQNMNPYGRYPEYNRIQIAIADNGMGIMESLRKTRPEVTDIQIALKNCILPFYSGAFKSHQRGSATNAGLGLFMISEIAKETCGNLFISTKGGSMMQAPITDDGEYHISFPKCSYPGTLVVFELSKSLVFSHSDMLEQLKLRARVMASFSPTDSFLKYDNIPSNAFAFLVRLCTENTAEAEKYIWNRILPEIRNRKDVVYDFGGIEIGTQSFLHALLFLPIQEAKRNQTSIFIANATDKVLSGLKWVDEYLSYDSVHD